MPTRRKTETKAILVAVAAVFGIVVIACAIVVVRSGAKSQAVAAFEPRLKELAEIAVKQRAKEEAIWESKSDEEKLSDAIADKKRHDANPDEYQNHTTEVIDGHTIQATKEPAPKIVGKIVTLTRNRGAPTSAITIHDAFTTLDPARSAKAPTDIGTVVLLELFVSEVGKYGNVFAANRSACHVTCVNRLSGEIIAEARIIAPELPSASRRSQTSRVNESVIKEWLNSLPQIR